MMSPGLEQDSPRTLPAATGKANRGKCGVEMHNAMLT